MEIALGDGQALASLTPLGHVLRRGVTGERFLVVPQFVQADQVGVVEVRCEGIRAAARSCRVAATMGATDSKNWSRVPGCIRISPAMINMEPTVVTLGGRPVTLT